MIGLIRRSIFWGEGETKGKMQCKTKELSGNGTKWRKERMHGIEESTEWADANEWNSKQNARKRAYGGTGEVEWWSGVREDWSKMSRRKGK